MLKISQAEQAFQHDPHPWDGEDRVNGRDGIFEVGRTFRVRRFPDDLHVFPVLECGMRNTFRDFVRSNSSFGGG